MQKIFYHTDFDMQKIFRYTKLILNCNNIFLPIGNKGLNVINISLKLKETLDLPKSDISKIGKCHNSRKNRLFKKIYVLNVTY